MPKFSLHEYLIIGLVVALVIAKAAWPMALVIIALLGFKAFEQYLNKQDNIKQDDTLKDKLVSIENKMAMMGLTKRN